MNKRYIYVLLVGFFVVLQGCGQKAPNVDFENYEQTYEVTTGTIISNNKYVGSLQSEEETYLSFKVPGIITDIRVKQGSSVKLGDVLAILEGSEIKSQYSSVASMIASLNTMYKNTESMFDAQIKSMQDKIEQAKLGMQGLKTGLGDTETISDEQLKMVEKQKEQAEIAVNSTKTALENLKQVLSQTEEQIYSNSKNSLSRSLIIEFNFLDFVDKLFGISEINLHKNDKFENYLSAKNSSLKVEIKQLWTELNSSFENDKKDIDVLIKDIEDNGVESLDENQKTQIYDSLKAMEKNLIKSRELASLVYEAINNSTPSAYFPQTMINSYLSQTNTFQDNIESILITATGNYLVGIKGSIQAIDKFADQAKMQIDGLEDKIRIYEKQYETAQQTYSQYKAMAEGNINKISTQYDVAKKQYDEALNGLEALKKQKTTQLSQINSQITQLKGNKNLAAVNLGNIKIYAPYDGVITEKLGNVGQVVGPGVPILKIANPNKMKGIFYMPIETIKNIKLGDQVFIEGLGKTLTGNVSVIYPSADMMSKKIPVEIHIDNIPVNWKLGMYIVGYSQDLKLSGLVVPQDIIKYQYSKPYVFKKSSDTSDKYEKTFITLKKCDNYFCIVEGLKQGDIVR